MALAALATATEIELTSPLNASYAVGAHVWTAARLRVAPGEAPPKTLCVTLDGARTCSAVAAGVELPAWSDLAEGRHAVCIFFEDGAAACPARAAVLCFWGAV